MRPFLLVAVLALASCKSGLPAASLSASAFGVTVALDSRPLVGGISDAVKTTAVAVGAVAPDAGGTK